MSTSLASRSWATHFNGVMSATPSGVRDRFWSASNEQVSYSNAGDKHLLVVVAAEGIELNLQKPTS